MSSLLDDLNDLNSGGEEDDDEYIVIRPSAAGGLAGSKRGRADSSDAIGPQAGPAARGGAGSAGAAEGGEDGDEGASDDDEAGEAGAADGDGEHDAAEAAEMAAAAASAKEARDAELESQLQQLGGRGGFKQVARLRDTRRFQQHMERVEAAMANETIEPVAGPLEEWPEYKLLVASNAVVTALDDEIVAVHRYAADIYRRKMPELENIVPGIIDYVRVVRVIGNEVDMTRLDLSAVLPPATVMVVTVTGSTTAAKPLPEYDLKDCLAACDEVLALDAARRRVLSFVESRMESLAPNTSVMVGTAVAAQLLGIAGGLAALSRTPSCNVQVLGQKRRHAAGLSRASYIPHAGVIFDSPLVRCAPVEWKRKAAKVLAAKLVLAARVDCYRESPSGDVGRSLLKVVADKLAKWQEPAPARTKKALKAPDDRPARKRGGRRYRALKEKLGMTDVRKEANRMSMTGGGEYGDVSMGRDTGMLGGSGGAGSGSRLRLERKEQKILKKRKLAIGQGGGGGTLSSFAFTPVQGMELRNPAAHGGAGGATTTATAFGSVSTVGGGYFGGSGGTAASANYFSNTGTFSMIRR